MTLLQVTVLLLLLPPPTHRAASRAKRSHRVPPAPPWPHQTQILSTRKDVEEPVVPPPDPGAACTAPTEGPRPASPTPAARLSPAGQAAPGQL